MSARWFTFLVWAAAAASGLYWGLKLLARPQPLPAQVLDHATGYLLAYGAMSALLRQYRAMASTGLYFRGMTVMAYADTIGELAIGIDVGGTNIRAGIVELNLEHVTGNATDNGNLLGLVSDYKTSDGHTHAMADVWFSKEGAPSSPALAHTTTE